MEGRRHAHGQCRIRGSTSGAGATSSAASSTPAASPTSWPTPRKRRRCWTRPAASSRNSIGVLVEHPQGTWTASELVELCSKHGLLAADLGEGSPRSLATKMGTLAGRFVGERFPLGDGRQAVFHRSDDRKGKSIRCRRRTKCRTLMALPNLCRTSEMPQVRHLNLLGDKQMRRHAEPCRTFLVTYTCARVHAHARGF